MTTTTNLQDSRAPANTTVTLPSDYLLPYASCYVYSPKGQSDPSQRSRELCNRVKAGNTQWLRTYAAIVHQEVLQGRALKEAFHDHPVLVPVPEYRVSGPNTVWIARRVARALQQAGLAEEVWTGLRRISSVERSASAWMWERPTVEKHYQSFAVVPSSKDSKERKSILLVDDVITKGRTLAAAAMRIQEAFPRANVRAFTLIRTMGFVRDVPRLLDPCQGAIHWNGRDAHRTP